MSPTPLCKHSISAELMNSLKLFPMCPIILDALCALPSTLHESTPFHVSNPRMNSPRKSGLAGVPPPSAADHHAGHAERLNAITAHDGTADAICESSVWKFATILFHSAELIVDEPDTVETGVRTLHAAYATPIPIAPAENAAPAKSEWESFRIKTVFMLSFLRSKEGRRCSDEPRFLRLRQCFMRSGACALRRFTCCGR